MAKCPHDSFQHVCSECASEQSAAANARNIADLTRPFKPCAIYYPDDDCTELVLADVGTVWASRESMDLGYDMETGELVAIRVNGDVTDRRTLSR